ncbi:hypothetical protein [Bacillus sp. 179-C3.3 HS]|uniref:hypothetical protein n=1 Tax=Bacillus sp. 179-C3.3 HS TaxID=3232162 RepID=UPI0039A34461
MKIKTYIYLEDEEKFVTIREIETIKSFVETKEDFMVQGMTNLEGTITFDNGKKGKIEDFENPDSIEELWHYYKNVLKDYIEEGYGNIYYPSLPIEIQLEKKSDREITLKLQDQLLVAEFKEFVYQLIESGRQFIAFLDVITGRPDDSDLRDELDRIEKVYKTL